MLDRVRHVRMLSSQAPLEDGPIDLLYVDGAHRFGPARDDIVRWGARVRDGGTMLVHDSFSSIGVTLALLRHRHVLAPLALRRAATARWPSTCADVPAAARSSAARQLAQLPWFACNVVRQGR